VADILGRRVTVIRSTDGIHGPVTEIEAALDDDVALVSLSHVSFKSGYMYDMERVTRAAHAAGALVLWDVSHSVGVVPLRLLDDHVDLAVGCTYKYLNGGPGSPAFLFAHPSLVNDLTNPIPGWWAHREPFAFDLEFAPESGIRRLLTGTMPILSLSALEPALPIVLDAGIDTIRAKSVALTEYFVELVDARLTDLGFTLTTPRDPGRRGSHIAVRHDDGWRITRAMIEHGRVIPDFRDPDNIRFGLVPLYTTFTELEIAVGRICDLVARGAHLRYANTRTVVT
jgi:kynureninase